VVTVMVSVMVVVCPLPEPGPVGGGEERGGPPPPVPVEDEREEGLPVGNKGLRVDVTELVGDRIGVPEGDPEQVVHVVDVEEEVGVGEVGVE